MAKSKSILTGKQLGIVLLVALALTLLPYAALDWLSQVLILIVAVLLIIR